MRTAPKKVTGGEEPGCGVMAAVAAVIGICCIVPVAMLGGAGIGISGFGKSSPFGMGVGAVIFTLGLALILYRRRGRK